MSDWKNPENPLSVDTAVSACLPGVILAGGLFAASFVLIQFAAAGPPAAPVALELLTVIGMVAGFGCMLAAISGIFSAMVVVSVNHLVKGLLSRRTAVVSVGGLSGFLPSFFPLLFFYHASHLVDFVGVFWPFLFPILTAMFGQIGPVWMANSAKTWYNQKQELEYCAQHPQPTFQFRTMHLFKIMILISLVLALNQLTPNHEVLLIVFCYIVIQSFWLLVDYVHFRRWQRKLMAADEQAPVTAA